jgi:hypothetical protein
MRIGTPEYGGLSHKWLCPSCQDRPDTVDFSQRSLRSVIAFLHEENLIADSARLTLTRFVAVDAHRSPSSEHSGSGHLAVERPGISVPRFRRGNSRDGLIRAEPRSRPAVMRTSGVPRCDWAPRQAMVGSAPHAASWAAVPRSGP